MRKVFRVIFFIFIILYVVIHLFSSVEGEGESTNTYDTEDSDREDTLDNQVVRVHRRVWSDANDSKRELQYAVSSTDYLHSFYFRDTVRVSEDQTEKGFWHDLYFNLYDHDKELLTALQDSIMSLSSKENIQDTDLMYSVVTMVQDIPYNYILSTDSCETHTDHGCVPSQRYGLLSPVEFLYSLSGDCDTRTVLLFTLLKKMGYSPVIVNSYQYRHSMLAVDAVTGGDYFEHNGRKFYFWETTNTGWMPGMLPPNMNNTDYWTIILDYEFKADPTRDY